MFVEENGDLEVTACQDPEPCGTGAGEHRNGKH